jgi:TetR/AcrR family transcriptional repressor of lmrAB and yxaGH operons
VARRSDTRDRMIAAALDLFGRQGYHATAFSEVVAVSGAPRGSIYFHFPGGKDELAEAVCQAATVELAAICDEAAARSDSPAAYVRALADVVSMRLESSGYERGCAVATMVLELAPRSEPLRTAFERCFAEWRAALSRHLVDLRVRPEDADGAAVMIMSTIEGALLISRAMRSTAPLASAVDQLVGHLPTPVGTRRRSRAAAS